jgi:ADP-ribosylglycohydrolase
MNQSQSIEPERKSEKNRFKFFLILLLQCINVVRYEIKSNYLKDLSMTYFIILFTLLISTFYNTTFSEMHNFDAKACGLLKDRIAGAFIGAAIGDALGRLTERIPTVVEIKKKFGPDGIFKFDQRMQIYLHSVSRNVVPYTDDTLMSIILTHIMVEDRQSNLTINDMMDHLARACVQLLGNNRFYNDPLFAIRAHDAMNIKACQILQQYLIYGIANKNPLWWYRNTAEFDKRFYELIAHEGGSGSVMRAWPLGIIFADNIQCVKELADKQSCITHRHPMARAASVAMAVGTSQALLQKTPDEVAQAMICAAQEFEGRELLYKKNAKKVSNEMVFDASMVAHDTLVTSDMLRYAYEMAKGGKDPEEVLGLNNDIQTNFRSQRGSLLGWAADEAVSAALYIFMRHADDLQGALIEGANTPGDSDTIASLAGALVGARTGIQLLNYCEFDYSALENLDHIQALASDVYGMLKRELAKKPLSNLLF